MGVGDLGATSHAGEGLKTFALGSCVAVIIMDPKSRCVAMDHIALPESSTSPERAKQKPGYFADTGIPALLQAMKRSGADGNYRGMIVKLVGGANVMDKNNTFNIGKRNVLAIRKILWGYGMGAVAEDIGGQISRTVEVDVDNGRVRIFSPGRDSWEI
ncbi:MAG: chemotaxis protein CheD [Gemmatimonadota bacterium]|nr:chemotaxis protein CheD [Gemmatimonadota bacterium]